MHGVVSCIRLWYREKDALLFGIELYDGNATRMLRVGTAMHYHKDFYLADNERIIGFKARKYSEKEAWLKDF